MRVLAAETQWVAVLLTVVKQPTLVALQDRLGDFAGPDDAPFCRPFDEAVQIVEPLLDSKVGVVVNTQPSR